MAEMRLADDDKDRKYRIRINKDGEEELEIIEPEEEPAEEEDYLSFQADDEEQDGEDPEVTAELMRAAREEQERLARAEARSFIDKAKAKIEEGDISYALVALDSAQEAFDEEWEVYTLKLELLTEGFTDLSRIDECLTLKEGYIKFVPEEVRKQIADKYAANIQSKMVEEQQITDSVQAENDEKKAARRLKFRAQRNRSLRNFLLSFVPFVAVLIAAFCFLPVMFSPDGVYFVVTIVLFALAVVGFIVSVIFLKPLVRDISRLNRNEKNTSTAIGRTYIESSKKSQELTDFYEMITYTAVAKEEYASVIDGDVSLI